MADKSPVQQLRELETHIYSLPRLIETEGLGSRARQSVQAVKTSVAQARSLLHDYETFEDSQAQAKVLAQGTKCLEQLQQNILAASQFDLIGPVDVAQISAHIEQILERLR